MVVIIRKMELQDYQSVYELWINTPGMGLNDHDDSETGIGKYLLRNPNTCFVACHGERIVGVILSGHDGRRAYLHHTAVLLAYRKQGIGKKLVEAAIGALKAEGIQKVAFVVFKHNHVGNNFWEKLGFTARNDLIYRNKEIGDAILNRIDT